MEMSSAHGLPATLYLHISLQNGSLSYLLGPALDSNKQSEQKYGLHFHSLLQTLTHASKKKVAQLDSSH